MLTCCIYSPCGDLQLHSAGVCPCVPQMMFRVKDLEASKQYYTEALGMKLLRESENEKVRMRLCHGHYPTVHWSSGRGAELCIGCIWGQFSDCHVMLRTGPLH